MRTQTDATAGLEARASRAYHKFAEVFMRTNLEVGGRVLELGSGQGGTTQLLAERGCEVTAVDVEGTGARAAVFIHGDVSKDETWERVRSCCCQYDGLVSDLAVAIDGDYETGQQPLMEAALRGTSMLTAGAWAVVKVRGCGGAVRGFIQRLAELFEQVRVVKPVTSRACSSEVFVVATRKGGRYDVPAAHVSAACREHTKNHVMALEHAVAGGTFEVDVPRGLIEACVARRVGSANGSGSSVKIGGFTLDLGGKPQWEFGVSPDDVSEDDGVGVECCWMDDDYDDDGVAVVNDHVDDTTSGDFEVGPEMFPPDVPWRVVVPCDVTHVVKDYEFTSGRCLFDSVNYLLPGVDALERVLAELGDDRLARELRAGRWGDDEALAVLSRVLGKPICVHMDDYCVQFGTQGDPVVHLRLSGEHYMPMQCVGTVAGDFVHAIATCGCAICRGLMAAPDATSRSIAQCSSLACYWLLLVINDVVGMTSSHDQ